MKIDFVDLFAKVLVLNFLLLLATFAIFRETITAGEIPPALTLLVSVNGISAFFYPVSILFRRTDEKSYHFIKSWLHYIALSITALYWIVIFT